MKKVLGKGLDSLIPEQSGNEIKEIKIDNIIPNKYQMRKNFDEGSLAELSESIKENNIVQPILVTRSGRKYMLIAGERRLRAAKKAGLKSVPCIEKDMSEDSYLVISLIENIQRENLSPVEEAAAYDRMLNDFSMTQQEIAEKVGKSRSAVANIIRILALPQDLKDMIDAGKISAGHARALLPIKDAKKRMALARKIVKEKLTVRETEKLAALISGAGYAKKQKRSTAAAPEVRDMEEKFEKALGTKVKIKLAKDGKGKIEISFYSFKDFDRIADKIC